MSPPIPPNEQPLCKCPTCGADVSSAFVKRMKVQGIALTAADIEIITRCDDLMGRIARLERGANLEFIHDRLNQLEEKMAFVMRCIGPVSDQREPAPQVQLDPPIVRRPPEPPPRR